MEGQTSIFDILSKKAKPCECGNTRLAVRYTGCGVPMQFSPITVYENYIFCVFCPKCYRVATSSGGWRSNKLNIKDTVRDWNERPHKVESQRFISGKYGLEHYADVMDETLERFPELIEFV